MNLSIVLNMSKSSVFYRNLSIIRIQICEHFAQFKWWYVIFGCICLSGIIIGLVIGIRIAPDATIDKLPDAIYLNYLNGNNSTFGYFFSRFFAILAMLALIYCTNCKPFLCCFSFLLLIYQSFVLGATSALLIVLFGIGGIVNVIFILIPFHLTTLFIIMIWAIVCVCFNLRTRTFGGSIYSNQFWCDNKILLICVTAAILTLCILEVILLPWLSSAIIIVVD